MKAETLDTNVILRYILRDNEKHFSRASRLLNDQRFIKFRATDAALIETVHVLEFCYKLPREYIRDQITDFLSIETIVSSPDFNIPIALSLYANRPKLSFMDCYLASETEKSGASPLWTFDKKLASQSPVAKEVPE
ncbi:PIN domain-containing protein [Candidatus Saccharibacteria bacterium]|nr:PIN domain-containing protein [Candidatus Saccharibacteria bacterium]